MVGVEDCSLDMILDSFAPVVCPAVTNRLHFCLRLFVKINCWLVQDCISELFQYALCTLCGYAVDATGTMLGYSTSGIPFICKGQVGLSATTSGTVLARATSTSYTASDPEALNGWKAVNVPHGDPPGENTLVCEPLQTKARTLFEKALLPEKRINALDSSKGKATRMKGIRLELVAKERSTGSDHSGISSGTAPNTGSTHVRTSPPACTQRAGPGRRLERGY